MIIEDPEILEKYHDLTQFDCGEKSLNDWLQRNARQNMRKDICRVYVSTAEKENRVLGYYAIAPSSIGIGDADPSVFKGLPKKLPIPAILLARLAVDQSLQGHGMGEALLLDAMKKIVQAADIISGRIILVHALNEKARDFYLQYGFEPFPSAEPDDLTLFMRVKEAKATLLDVGIALEQGI